VIDFNSSTMKIVKFDFSQNNLHYKLTMLQILRFFI